MRALISWPVLMFEWRRHSDCSGLAQKAASSPWCGMTWSTNVARVNVPSARQVLQVGSSRS
jgi:hypothetical protein